VLRRGFIKTLVLALPLIKLGRVITTHRKKTIEDLSPIPWIGHC
jgi:hypothetical protein